MLKTKTGCFDKLKSQYFKIMPWDSEQSISNTESNVILLDTMAFSTKYDYLVNHGTEKTYYSSDHIEHVSVPKSNFNSRNISGKDLHHRAVDTLIPCTECVYWFDLKQL